MRLNRDDSLLLVIDIQRKLAPAIQDHVRVTARTEALVSATELFGIPKLITEHCPQQIGALVEPLRSRFRVGEIFEKTAFSATDHPAFLETVRATGRRQVVMAGTKSKWARAHKLALPDLLGEPWVLPPPDSIAATLVTLFGVTFWRIVR